MQSKRLSLAAVAAAAMLAAFTVHAAFAHDAEQGPHGGPVVEVKGHHIELIAKGSDIVLYLTDEAHGALASKGASGRAVILEGSKQSTVPLAPAEPNILTGKLDSPLATGTRVVVSVKLSDGHDVLVRFVLK